ncbi:MAG: hypothetical protein U0800_17165 [Isosphaeraceae bacterium]
MPSNSESSKYRAAIEVLQKGRDVLVESMTLEILDQGEEFAEGGFLFQEFLETHGTRLHFLSLLVAQLEQSAEMAEESSRSVCIVKPVEPDPEEEPTAIAMGTGHEAEPPAPPKRRRARSKAKKLQETSAEGRADEA